MCAENLGLKIVGGVGFVQAWVLCDELNSCMHSEVVTLQEKHHFLKLLGC